MEKERTRKYLLTIHNPTDVNVTKETIAEALKPFKVRYYCHCEETGSQGTHHIHLYIEFVNAIQFKTIKEMFPTAHIDVPNGNAMQNRSYILKSDPSHRKNADGTYCYKDASGTEHAGQNHSETFFEFGTMSQSKRSETPEAIVDMICDGYSNSEIVTALPKLGLRHYGKFDKIRKDIRTDEAKDKTRDVKVEYWFGKTGTGKSFTAFNSFDACDVYRITSYAHPWDGYNCERVVIMEEFRDSIPLCDLLTVLDVYPTTLPARYSDREACFEHVIIISNWKFEEQFKAEQLADPESYEAFKRRINGGVTEFIDIGNVKKYETLDAYLHRFQSVENHPF